MGSGKRRENVCCFRAMGTKAAPGKGRELRPKWKSLSWVLHSPSLVRISQLLWDRRQSTSQRAERLLEPFPSFSLQIPQNSGLEHKGSSKSSLLP